MIKMRTLLSLLLLSSTPVMAADTVYVGGERHTMDISDFTDPSPGSADLTRYLANLNVVGDRGRELIFDLDISLSGNGVFQSDFNLYKYKGSLLVGCNGTYVGIDDSEAYLFEAEGEVKMFVNKRATFIEPCQKLTIMAVSWFDTQAIDMNVAITEAF